MSPETREPKTRETLEVTLRAKVGAPEAVPHGTRTDVSHKVVWEGEDLARTGATLLVQIREGAHGNFFVVGFFSESNQGGGKNSWGIELDPNPGPPGPGPGGPVTLSIMVDKKSWEQIAQGI